MKSALSIKVKRNIFAPAFQGNSFSFPFSAGRFSKRSPVFLHFGLVAQLNSASDYGSEGCRFESCRGHLKRKPCIKMQGFVFWERRKIFFRKRTKMTKPQHFSDACLHFQERVQRITRGNPIGITSMASNPCEPTRRQCQGNNNYFCRRKRLASLSVFPLKYFQVSFPMDVSVTNTSSELKIPIKKPPKTSVSLHSFKIICQKR